MGSSSHNDTHDYILINIYATVSLHIWHFKLGMTLFGNDRLTLFIHTNCIYNCTYKIQMRYICLAILMSSMRCIYTEINHILYLNFIWNTHQLFGHSVKLWKRISTMSIHVCRKSLSFRCLVRQSAICISSGKVILW